MLNLISLLLSRWALAWRSHKFRYGLLARAYAGPSSGNSIACRMRAVAGVKTTPTGTAGVRSQF